VLLLAADRSLALCSVRRGCSRSPDQRMKQWRCKRNSGNDLPRCVLAALRDWTSLEWLSQGSFCYRQLCPRLVAVPGRKQGRDPCCIEVHLQMFLFGMIENLIAAADQQVNRTGTAVRGTLSDGDLGKTGLGGTQVLAPSTNALVVLNRPLSKVPSAAGLHKPGNRR
jgi:hypothetical protein